MVNQSTQTDSPPTDLDDSLARDLFQCCGPAAVAAYHPGRLLCIGKIHFIDLPEPVSDVSKLVCGTQISRRIALGQSEIVKRNKMNVFINMNTFNSNIFELLFLF